MQQGMEDVLYGVTGPFLPIPPVPPLNLSGNNGSPPAPVPSAVEPFAEGNEDGLFLSSSLLTSAILERTLPMVDVVSGVLVSTIPGDGEVCRCFARSNLTVVAETTLESIVSMDRSNTTVCGKRKLSAIII